MPAFGRDAMLDRTQVTNVATYVQSLSNPAASTPQNIAQIQAGREVFLTTCAACHGEDGKGNREVGAPNLTDQFWVYGGDLQTLINTIHGGRQGHMPTWDERLTPAEIKILCPVCQLPGRREAMTGRSVTQAGQVASGWHGSWRRPCCSSWQPPMPISSTLRWRPSPTASPT